MNKIKQMMVAEDWSKGEEPSPVQVALKQLRKYKEVK